MRRIKGQAGMSLVEALIILLVLMLLTGVLAPNIFEFVKDGQMVKVKEDCEAIGIEVAKLVRDVGTCLRKHHDQPCAEPLGIMISDGRPVRAGDNDISGTWQDPRNGTGHWAWSLGEYAFDSWNTKADTFEHQLVTNYNRGQIYPTPADLKTFNVTYPAFGLGWRGAYLPPQIGPDPWGSRYIVNSLFLSVPAGGDTHGADANCNSSGGCGGHNGGGWDEDAICLSPGPNMLYETNFGGGPGYGTNRAGDDFIFVISGSSR